jgi:hypothetical protein
VIEACSNGFTSENDDCDPQTNMQLLVGYRVPATANSPASVASAGDDDNVSTTFHKSDSYASELQRLAPAAAGEQWVGYISDKLSLAATTHRPATTRSPSPLRAADNRARPPAACTCSPCRAS